MNIDESCCDRPSFCDLPFAARILTCHQPSKSPRVNQLTDPQFRFSTTADSPQHSQSPFVRIEPAFMDHDIDPEALPRAQQQVLPQPPGGSRIFSSLALPCEFLTVLNEGVVVTVIYERSIPPSEMRQRATSSELRQFPLRVTNRPHGLQVRALYPLIVVYLLTL